MILKTGESTLIQGPSGQGKTTILESIYWCFYGKVTGITPIQAEKKPKTWVRASFPGRELEIYRQTGPRILKVVHKGKTYEDTVAQAKIDELFGPVNLWAATSYLKQKKSHPLIFGTAAEKLALVTSLAFENNINPGEYISKVETKIKETRELLTKAEAEVKVRSSIHEEEIQKRKITEADLAMEIEDIPSLNSKIEELKNTISELKAKVQEFGRLDQEVVNLDKTLQDDELDYDSVRGKIDPGDGSDPAT